MNACTEVLRAIVAALLILVVGAMFTVVRLHWSAFQRCPKRVGLTPLHVAVVSSGVLVWGSALAWAMLDGIGNAVGIVAALRMWMYGIGAVLILVALGIMATIQRRRVQFGRKDEVVVVTRTDSVEVTNPDLPAKDEEDK